MLLYFPNFKSLIGIIQFIYQNKRLLHVGLGMLDILMYQNEGHNIQLKEVFALLYCSDEAL